MNTPWPNVVFGDIFDISSSKRVLQRQWQSSGVPFYRAREIVSLSEYGEVDNDLFISEELFHEFKEKYGVPEVGDLMVSAVGTLGACYVVQPHDKFYYKDASVIRLSPKMSVSSRFFQYALKTRSVVEQINKGSGSTVGTLTLSRAKGLNIALPPLEEQHRIVEILDQAQALIDKRKEQITLMDQLIQSLFYDMFGDPVTNSKGWNVDVLGNCLIFMTSGSRGWAKYYSDNGELFVRIQNVKGGRLDFSNPQYVIPPSSKEAERTRVQMGDLILSITADLGRTAVVDQETADKGAYINQHLCILRLGKNIKPLYAAHYLESKGGKNQIQRFDQVGVKSGLNFDAVKKIGINVPPISLQQEYDLRVSQIESQKQAMTNSLKELEDNFNSISQRAFKGEL